MQLMLAAISVGQAHCQIIPIFSWGYGMIQLNDSPQRPTRVWLQGLELGLASFRSLIALTTVLGFISLLPTLYMARKVGDAEISPESVLQLLKQGDFILTLLLLQLLVLVLTLFMNTLVIHRTDQAVHGGQRTDELSHALQKLWPLLLASILGVVTVLIGLIIAAVIGAIAGVIVGAIFGRVAAVVVTETCIFTAMIYIAIYLLFFQFAVVLDGKGPVGALNYSCALVFRNWWRTFLVLMLTVLVIIGILIMVAMPFALVLPIAHWLPAIAAADNGRTLLIKGIFRLAGTAIFTPFIFGILYVLYHDLKARYVIRSTPTGTVQA